MYEFKRTQLSKVMLNKVIIKDLTKDIKSVEREISRRCVVLDFFSARLIDALKSENYSATGMYNRKIRQSKKEIHDLECVVKTLKAVRKPYEDKVIRLRLLIGRHSFWDSNPETDNSKPFDIRYDPEYQMGLIEAECERL